MNNSLISIKDILDAMDKIEQFILRMSYDEFVRMKRQLVPFGTN